LWIRIVSSRLRLTLENIRNPVAISVRSSYIGIHISITIRVHANGNQWHNLVHFLRTSFCFWLKELQVQWLQIRI
jgi:hypothetical protein